MINFLNKHYNIIITDSDICYTENKSKHGSYHYVIPTLYCTAIKLREIHNNLLNINKNEFTYILNNITHYVVDLTVYRITWFRLPYQKKRKYR